ncbi:MAG: hypothetical protein DDG60_00695, partial [Anaerolineae bacterium]
LEDLEEAIRVLRQAVASTPPDSPDRPSRLNNLGNGLRDRYGRTGRLEDLEEAIRVLRQAVASTPPDSPDRPSILNNLGTGLRARYGRTGRLEDLEEARNLYRQACSLAETGSQDVLLTASRAWGDWAFERQAWAEAAEAYRFTFPAIEHLFRVQFSRHGKESWIREIQGLPARAAYALLQIGQPERALEALEAGRARLLGEALERSRRDLENLAALGHADLLERYRAASERYEALTRPSTGAERGEAAHSRPAGWLQQVEAAQAKLDGVIEQIRQVPGYETFLKTLTAEQIQAQAQGAPLVYLAATPAGGLALLVRAGAEVEFVPLPKLTEEALQKQVVGFSAKEYQALVEEAHKENRQPPSQADLLGGYLGAYLRWRSNARDAEAHAAWFAALDNTLAWLGKAVMGPLVERLQALGVPESALVRLIPGGWLGLLPLHAAKLPSPFGGGAGGEGEGYALDHYTFTYLPSAQALYHARAAAGRPAESLLVVDNPDGTLIASGQEAEAAQHAFRGRPVTVLKGKRATRERTRRAMQEHAVLHFSTHGMADWKEGKRSHIRLADGVLTLEEIFDLRLECPRLAVLSACETGVPALEAPDELVSLPTGLMLAGIPCVIGSLWAVNDPATALLMAWFYHFWREKGLEIPQALREAQCSLRDAHQSEDIRASLEVLAGWRMSAQQAEQFLYRVQVMDFSHPFYWAAFTCVGL